MKHYSERKRGSEAFIERCYNMISTIDTRSTYGRLKFQYMAAMVRIESLYSGLLKLRKILCCLKMFGVNSLKKDLICQIMIARS